MSDMQSPQTARIRILVVDDDPAISELFAFTFNLNGYRVSFAKTGNQAKEILAQQTIDLVLCDVHMPDGNGIELLQWVREKFPDVHFVVATGDPHFTAEDFTSKGAALFIHKPLSFKEVDRRIKELIFKKTNKRPA